MLRRKSDARAAALRDARPAVLRIITARLTGQIELADQMMREFPDQDALAAAAITFVHATVVSEAKVWHTTPLDWWAGMGLIVAGHEDDDA